MPCWLFKKAAASLDAVPWSFNSSKMDAQLGAPLTSHTPNCGPNHRLGWLPGLFNAWFFQKPGEQLPALGLGVGVGLGPGDAVGVASRWCALPRTEPGCDGLPV